MSLDEVSYSVIEGTGAVSVCVSLAGASLAITIPVSVEAVQTASATGNYIYTAF